MPSKCKGCGEFGVYFGKLCADCLRKAHDKYLKKHGIIKRLQISRDAVMKVRSNIYNPAEIFLIKDFGAV